MFTKITLKYFLSVYLWNVVSIFYILFLLGIPVIFQVSSSHEQLWPGIQHRQRKKRLCKRFLYDIRFLLLPHALTFGLRWLNGAYIIPVPSYRAKTCVICSIFEQIDGRRGLYNIVYALFTFALRWVCGARKLSVSPLPCGFCAASVRRLYVVRFSYRFTGDVVFTIFLDDELWVMTYLTKKKS